MTDWQNLTEHDGATEAAVAEHVGEPLVTHEEPEVFDSGKQSRLNDLQRTALAQVIERGPIPYLEGVIGECLEPDSKRTQ
ncbi:hypothetical protein GOL25_31730 [Sinorhizobium medicae]|nr:hypothetical protein [Sinorhizobium medicae]